MTKRMLFHAVTIPLKYLTDNFFLLQVLNIFFVRALNAHLSPEKTPIIVTAINPGFCYSGIRKNLAFPASTFTTLLEKTVARTTEEGSRQLVYGAIGGGKKEDRLGGAYVSGSDVEEVSDYVLSEEGERVQERIWVGRSFLSRSVMMMRCVFAD
jgi:retinol dehydrogenase 12